MCNAVYKARVHIGPKEPKDNEELKNVSWSPHLGGSFTQIFLNHPQVLLKVYMNITY